MKTKQELLARMDALGACDEATEYVSAHESDSAEQIWHDCPRADWLLWLATRIGVEHKALVLAACACARTALRFVPEGELRPLKAIETAEAWTRGEARVEEVRTAAYATADAADAAYAAADATDAAADAADAAYAAADAAYAAYAAADAAYAAADADAADAAYAAADAAYAAYAAREKALAEMAVLVRMHIPFSMVQEACK